MCAFLLIPRHHTSIFSHQYAYQSIFSTARETNVFFYFFDFIDYFAAHLSSSWNWAERAKLNRKWRLWQVPVGLILMSFSSFFLVYAKWALQRRYRDSSAWTMNAQFRYTSAGIAHYDPSISSHPLHHDHPPSAYHEPPSQLRLVSRNIAMSRSRHDANRLR